MAGGRDFKKPGAAAAPGAADADASSGRMDPRMMSLRMRSRKEAQSGDAEVQKLLQGGNQDPQAYAKAIAASDQPRNALLGDIKDKLGPELADKVSEALVAIELKDGGDDKDDKKGDDDKGGSDLASSDNFDDAAGDAAKSPTGMSAKSGDDDLGAEGYTDKGKAGVQVSGKSGNLSGDVGVQEDNGKGTVSGTVDYAGDDNEVQASGSVGQDGKAEGTVAGSHNFTDELSGQASLAASTEDGLTAGVGGKYENDDFAVSAEVDANKKGDATSVTAKGSGTAKLMDGKLYATVTGSAKMGDAEEDAPRFNLGGSVTLTTGEHQALVASGAMDDKGGLDLTLEYDIFKDKIKNAGDVDDAKKDALISLYTEYKQGGDDKAEDGLTAGVKLRF
jgi:hypothetical protein